LRLLAKLLLYTLHLASLAFPESAVAQWGSDATQGNAAPIEATLGTLPADVRAGESAALRLELADPAGFPIQDLVTHHGRRLHVVIVSRDMQVFGHVHPQDFGAELVEGAAIVEFVFPRPGRYLVSVDAMTAAGPFAEHFTLAVAGDEAELASGEVLSPARLVVVKVAEGDVYTAPVLLDRRAPTDGYEMSVSRPGTIRAGEEVTLTWRLTKDGVPITDLRLFLEAAMHLAVVKNDLGQFVHGHGVAKGIDTGYDHTHGTGGAEGDATGVPDIRYFGPEIIAAVTFPEPGRYYLFGQAAHGENLLISRIAVDVGG
jgi:hypothetical protein